MGHLFLVEYGDAEPPNRHSKEEEQCHRAKPFEPDSPKQSSQKVQWKPKKKDSDKQQLLMFNPTSAGYTQQFPPLQASTSYQFPSLQPFTKDNTDHAPKILKKNEILPDGSQASLSEAEATLN